MAMIEWSIPHQSIRRTRGMGAPRTATMAAWYRQARKVLPEIPKLPDPSWTMQHEEATLRWIKYTLVDSRGNRAYLTIDRQKNGLGA